MITRSQWRVRVANSILLMLLFAIHTALCQSVSKDPLHKEITLRGENLSFEQILFKLTQQTKLYFIYSSNSIELNKPVSLDLNRRPLSEVLQTLSEQMNLTFRKEGNYVIVKKGSPNNESLTVLKSRAEKNAPRNSEKVLLDVKDPTIDNSIASSRKEYTEKVNQISIPYQLLRKNLLDFPSDFSVMDTSVFKKYSLLKITNPRPGRKLFTSLRLIANEYSGGLEIHWGIPSLYAVLNAGLMAEGYFRYGFGLGTSIPVKPRLTLMPIYTYAILKQEKDYVIDENLNLVVPGGLKLKGQHHQAKFIFQYQTSRQITIHAGPTFNFLKTSYSYPEYNLSVYDVEAVKGSRPGDSYSVLPSPPTVKRLYYYPPQENFTFKSWIGFEVGISYLIKFPYRK